MVKFVVKSKAYAATKVLSFMENYRRELRIEVDIRKKEKVEKMTELIERTKKIYVVSTTRWNGTCDMLTSAKLSVGYLVVEITRELDKEPSLHCYPIYISYKWSVLQQCVYLISTP